MYCEMKGIWMSLTRFYLFIFMALSCVTQASYALSVDDCLTNSNNKNCYNIIKDLQLKNLTNAQIESVSQIYNAACANKNSQACLSAGDLYQQGRWITQNTVQAEYYFAQGCQLDRGENCARLLLLQTFKDDHQFNQQQTSNVLNQKCNEGDHQACQSLADQLFSQGKVQQASHFYNSLCYQQLSSKACESLSHIYTNGSGDMRQDVQRGLTIAEFMCDNQMPRGCSYLATEYSKGQLVSKNLNKAEQYLNKACQLKDQNSCQILVTIKEQNKTTRLPLETQCSVANPQACIPLADAYLLGTHAMHIDHAKAYKFYDTACQAKDAYACTQLAAMYFNGQHVRRNQAQAAKLNERTCQTKQIAAAPACMALAEQYAQGKGVTQNRLKAREYYQQGCQLNNPTACNHYIQLLIEDKNYKQAIALAERQCFVANSAEVCFNLGNVYADKKLPISNTEKALTAYDFACSYNYTAACTQLADFYATGTGVSKNLGTARYYYQKACKDDNQQACKALQSLN